MEMKLKTGPRSRSLSRLSRALSGTLAAVSLAAVACGGSELEQRDLGNTSAPDSNERTALIKDSTVDPFIVGHWRGEAEDLFSPPGPDGTRPPYTFPSGSTQISLDLAFGDPLQNIVSALAGGITFGEGSVPEPTAGLVYPPGITNTYGDLATIPPLEGFAYRVSHDGSTVQGALAIGYTATESYKDWCPLQPARLDVSGNFDCITLLEPPYEAPSGNSCTDRQEAKDPTSGITFGMNLHYDCSLGWLCQACTCAKKGCTAAYSEPPVQLWLVRSGEDLFGNFVRAVFDYGDGRTYLPVGNVRFKRQAP